MTKDGRVVCFPIPELVNADNEVLKYSLKTNIGAARYIPFHYKEGKPDRERPHDAIDVYTAHHEKPRHTKKGIECVGANVVAVADATVLKTGSNSVSGNFVKIRFYGADGKRYTASYRHLHSINPDIKEGQRINNGQILGTVGNTGNASHLPFPILCFAMTCNGRAIDPWKVFYSVNFSEPEQPLRVVMNIGDKREAQKQKIR